MASSESFLSACAMERRRMAVFLSASPPPNTKLNSEILIMMPKLSSGLVALDNCKPKLSTYLFCAKQEMFINSNTTKPIFLMCAIFWLFHQLVFSSKNKCYSKRYHYKFQKIVFEIFLFYF